MKKSTTVVIIIVVVVLIAVGAWALTKDKNKNSSSTQPAAGSSSQSSSQSSTQTTANPAPVSTDQVTIQNEAFSPSDITIKKGTKVTWTNKDAMSHTVTGDTSGGPSSQTLNQEDTYSFTFNTAGTFKYHCNFHSFMTGSVVVTE